MTDGINYTNATSVSIKDNIKPNAPSISGGSGWYTANQNITITAGSDGQSGTNYVRYSVSGAQTIGTTNTSAGTTSATITISAEGTSTITAYTIDKAGNVSSASTRSIKIDKTNPTASINPSSASITEKQNVSFTVTHSDSTSGVNVGQCKWVINSSNAALGTNPASYTDGTFTSNKQTISKNMASTGTYYLHVLTVDYAGHKKETISGAITVKSALEKVSTLTNCVGKYAYVDGEYGIIYADRAIGHSGEWGSEQYIGVNYGDFNIPKETGLKEYYVKEKEQNKGFGNITADVIAQVQGTSGTERFHVMKLKNAQGPGLKTTFRGAKDMESGRWILPTRNEWAAFAKNLKITSRNYRDFGLDHIYWCNGSYYGDGSYDIYIAADHINYSNYRNSYFARMSTTF